MAFLILNHDADAFRQEIYIRDLNLEVTNLELAENVTSAQHTTANLYNDLQETKSAESTPQNRLTSFLSSTRTQKQKLRSQMDQRSASVEYYDQGEPREQ